MQSTRMWGDGHTDRSRHLIADITYGEFDGPSSLVCADGEEMHADSPDELARLWQAHGGAVAPPFARDDSDVGSVGGEVYAEREAAALSAILRLSSQCRCHTGPITECPNYMKGDELEDEDE